MLYTLEYQRTEFGISTTFPYRPLVGPHDDRRGKKFHGLVRLVLITFLKLLLCIFVAYILT